MPASAPITAAILYDLVHCPQRAYLDRFGDPARRDPVSPFVQLLWERGALYEKEVIAKLAIPFLDLTPYRGEEKEVRTREAMARREPLIYSGRLRAGELLGEPDLLRLENGAYVPGDIKSGAGVEGTESEDEDRKPKKHYAVQLALYVDTLERLNASAGRRGFIWDVHGEEVPYDLTASQGPRTPTSLWDVYLNALTEARQILGHTAATRPAYATACKQCHWYTACLADLRAAHDLTLLPELGRAKREALEPQVRTIAKLARLDLAACTQGKKTIFSGIGPDTLAKFKARAELAVSPDRRPYAKAPLDLPVHETEVFFDIEVDPLRDVCYLHGFVERHHGDNATERYIACFARVPNPEDEEEAFRQAWEYLSSRREAGIYYYSPYERTHYRKLQQRYPRVCTAAEIEVLFRDAADLYHGVVRPHTEWPTVDFSIKTLAKYLGFAWRDTDPSGAASIEWFDQWVKTNDPAIEWRILEYNEDDCRATRVLLDGLRALPVRSRP